MNFIGINFNGSPFISKFINLGLLSFFWLVCLKVCLLRPEEGVKSPGAGITVVSCPVCGLLEEQKALLCAEVSPVLHAGFVGT